MPHRGKNKSHGTIDTYFKLNLPQKIIFAEIFKDITYTVHYTALFISFFARVVFCFHYTVLYSNLISAAVCRTLYRGVRVQHRESTTRELNGRGRHFFTQIETN